MFIEKLEAYDILIIFFVTSISAYLAGFMTVKMNHLLVIVLGKIWTSGHGQQRYVVVGASMSTVYLAILIGLFEDFIFHFYVLLFLTFVGLYVAGLKHAEKRSSQVIFDIIPKMIELVYLFDKNDELQQKAIHDAKVFSKKVIFSMPKSTGEALQLLFFFFDSRMAVFFVSIINGRFRVSRFINLSEEDQIHYVESWANNPYLFVAMQAIKGLMGFSYYTSEHSWESIKYNGKLLSNSYLR